MTDTQYLDRIINESGKKRSYLASVLGISRQALWKKERNIIPFTVKEVNTLCGELNITDLRMKESIFFAN